MTDDHLLETTIDRRLIYDGRFFRVRVDTIVDAQGRTHTREVVVHPGAIAVLALDGEELLMVRQFRTPVGEVLLEIPAGTLDVLADGSIEDPAVAGPRELGEETGHTASSWRLLGRFFPAPGFASERMHLYLATGLAPIPGYSGPDTDERIAVVRMPWHEAVRLADAGELRDAKTILAVYWLERLIRGGEVRVR